MKRFFVFALFVSLLAAQTAAPSANKITDVAWISGDWKLEWKGRVVEEHWTQPAGGTMIGVSRTVAREKTIEFEFLRIIEREGKLVYLAQPGGRAATEFTATSVSAEQVVFENPQHDFPKRIMYKKVSDRCVTASIDGGEGTKRIEFPYCRP